MLLTALIASIFQWLPLPLFICVWAIVGAVIFSVLLKVVGIILDLVFKFIDIFV